MEAASGRQREVPKGFQGIPGKDLALNFFMHLAYLVKKCGLTAEDIFNMDETSKDLNANATGSVIANKGSKQVNAASAEDIRI